MCNVFDLKKQQQQQKKKKKKKKKKNDIADNAGIIKN